MTTGWNVVREAVATLNATGSPSTRTHIQKLLYFAEAWRIPPPTPYSFVIHMHGPYSFQLDRDLIDMEAFGILKRIRDAGGYGSRYEADGPPGSNLTALAEWLGSKSARQLEAIATTQFVIDSSETDVTAKVQALKPHLTREELDEALAEVKQKRATLEERVGGGVVL